MPDNINPNPNPASPEPNTDQSPKVSSGAVANEPNAAPATPSNTPIIKDETIDTQDSSSQTNNVSQPTTPQTQTTNTETPNTSNEIASEQQDPAVITSEDSGGSGGNFKKFALPVLGVLLLVGAVATGVYLTGQQQNPEEKASENCVPPVAGDREWWSVEIGNDNDLPSTDTGQIVDLEPGTTEVVVEAWSDSAFGCGSNQQDESAEVTVNGQVVTITDTDVPGSQTTQVQIGQDGILNITATALGEPGSMFVFVRVPIPPTASCEIPPAEGRLLLNFMDDASFLESFDQAQSMDFNTAGSNYRVLIQKTDEQNGKEFFVVLINNDEDKIYITRTNSIDNLPTDLAGYEELSDDNLTLGPDANSLATIISAETGQDPNSISVVCASFEQYEFETAISPTQPPSGLGLSCLPVKAYDNQWNELTNAELNEMQTGDQLMFSVNYEKNSDSSTVDKARFRINNGEWIETTDTRSNGAFYIEYTFPQGVTSFNVEAQVHLLDNDTWY